VTGHPESERVSVEAVERAARALHDLFHGENESGLGPDDCRDECVSPPLIWRAAAREALSAASAPDERLASPEAEALIERLYDERDEAIKAAAHMSQQIDDDDERLVVLERVAEAAQDEHAKHQRPRAPRAEADYYAGRCAVCIALAALTTPETDTEER
jgi:hypothetical protein